MVHTAPMWPDSIPRRVRHEAFEIAYQVLGHEAMEGFVAAGQEAALAHVVGVAGMCLYTARQAGVGEQAAERIARKGAVHDAGKPTVPGISDTGVWTQERRLWVRSEHCRQGGLWVARHAERLPDAAALQFTAEEHHSDVPPPEVYGELPGHLPEWWGDTHWVQGCDRVHAIISRPYVLEREGVFTAEDAVAIAFAADPRGQSPELPEAVILDGQNWELMASLGEVAEVLTTNRS
jgi:hypothetical protein